MADSPRHMLSHHQRSNKCVDVHLTTEFSGGLGGAGLAVGLNGFRELFQPK